MHPHPTITGVFGSVRMIRGPIVMLLRAWFRLLIVIPAMMETNSLESTVKYLEKGEKHEISRQYSNILVTKF